MGLEKDLLKRDLEQAKTPEEINVIAKDAELLGREDIIELAKKKLEAISAKAQSVETTSPAQIAQIEIQRLK